MAYKVSGCWHGSMHLGLRIDNNLHVRVWQKMEP